MDKIIWKVEGMTCSNCALSIQKFLEKEGMKEVFVNPIGGEVLFINDLDVELSKIKKGIESLGYSIVNETSPAKSKKNLFSTNKQRFWITLPFTLLLYMHMLHQWFPIHWIVIPWIQLLICSPVFLLGMWFFGRSALLSIKNRVPNMNVLIALGSLLSFVYSLIGMFYFNNSNFLFFETTASIITLVFLGNFLEESTIQSTQKALKKITKSQKVVANMIAFDDKYKEQIFPIDNIFLKTGDLILIKTGEQVPIDCKILWGECSVNESIITGESLPLYKSKKDILIGGSIIETGIIKAQVTSATKDTVLSGILKMVQNAQSEKPPIQKLADKISAVFVPVVIAISILAFMLNYFILSIPFDYSLMRSIAVLVISCPCAMGLATPAAISVGLGRAAKKGILFRNASSLENFKNIKQVVFDKTGTLTTGHFDIENFSSTIDENTFKSIVYSIEKYSTHPIAKSIVKKWGMAECIVWKKIEELKGLGMRAEDKEGNLFLLGSTQILTQETNNQSHNIYLFKNNEQIGWIDIKDEIRAETKSVINWFDSHQISTIMLTGDTLEKATVVAKELGIKNIIAAQSPSSKLKIIEELNSITPTAMIGDGINDAPALAKATIGISLSDASQLAIQHADVILMNQGLKNLPEALSLGRHTFLTIKQNLFWAFSYNIIAIPIAAAGLLTPTFSALAMGFSDIVLAIISLQLFVKKVI